MIDRPPRRISIDIADDRDLQRGAIEQRRPPFTQRRRIDGRHALARGAPRVRMIGIKRLIERQIGEIARIGVARADADQHLALDPLQGRRVEARLVQRQTRHLQRCVAVGAERRQAHADAVPPGAKAEHHVELLQPFLERVRIERTCAFGQHVGHHAGDAGLRFRFDRGTAAPIGAHHDHRHGRVRNQPRLDPARRNNPRHRHPMPRRR